MLVLTRKRSEMIHVDDDIVIKVIRTGKNCVKLGIEAPANIRVLRAELLADGESVGAGLETGAEIAVETSTEDQPASSAVAAVSICDAAV